MGKSIIGSVAGIIPTVLIIIVGVIAFVYLREAYGKTQEEKQKSKAFEERGLFASLGDYLLGKPKEGDRPEVDKDIDSEKNSAEKQAKTEYEDLQDTALVAHENALIKYTNDQVESQKLVLNLKKQLETQMNRIDRIDSSKSNSTKSKAKNPETRPQSEIYKTLSPSEKSTYDYYKKLQEANLKKLQGKATQTIVRPPILNNPLTVASRPKTTSRTAKSQAILDSVRLYRAG